MFLDLCLSILMNKTNMNISLWSQKFKNLEAIPVIFWFEPPAWRWWPNQFSRTSWFILPGMRPWPSAMARSARAQRPSTVVLRSDSVVIGSRAVVGVRSLFPYTSNSHHPNHIFIFLRSCWCEIKFLLIFPSLIVLLIRPNGGVRRTVHDQWNTFIRLHYFLVIVECHYPTSRWTFIQYVCSCCPMLGMIVSEWLVERQQHQNHATRNQTWCTKYLLKLGHFFCFHQCPAV